MDVHTSVVALQVSDWPHESPNGHELVPHILLRAGAVQIDYWHMLFPEPVHGGLVGLVKGPKAGNGCLDVVIRPSLVPINDALHQDRVVTVQMQRQLGCPTQLYQVVCVLSRPREAIEQDTFAGMMPHTTLNQFDHDTARHQLTLFHGGSHLTAEWCVALHFVTEHIAAGQMDHTALLLKTTTQSALTRARSTHYQHDAGRRVAQNHIGRTQKLSQPESSRTVQIGGIQQPVHHGIVRSLANAAQQLKDTLTV